MYPNTEYLLFFLVAGKDDKVCILCHFVEIANKASIQQQTKETAVSSTSLYHVLGGMLHDCFYLGFLVLGL